MKPNRFYIFPNLPVLFAQGLIILFFAISIFSLFAFRKTWLFSFDGISESVKKKVRSTDKQSFNYGEKYPYYLELSIYKDIDWLAKNMSQNEAKKVLNHPNPVLRVTAYRNLLNYNFDINQEGSYELLCQVLQEYGVLQGAWGDCGSWIEPVGYFFADMYLRLDNDTIQDKEYINSFKKSHNLTDLEMNHLIELYRISEQKIESIYESLR